MLARLFSCGLKDFQVVVTLMVNGMKSSATRRQTSRICALFTCGRLVDDAAPRWRVSSLEIQVNDRLCTVQALQPLDSLLVIRDGQVRKLSRIERGIRAI